MVSEERRAALCAASRRLQRRKMAMLDRVKIEEGCVDCGYNAHPVALDFDHRDGTTKHKCLGNFYFLPYSDIAAEIEKCDVRCSNCHRIRHADGRVTIPA